MCTHSHRETFDEIPVRNADGVVVGYAYYEGYADLAVTEENGHPELEEVEAIYVEASGEGREGELISLKESDPVFITIEFEIKRQAAAGKIGFERSSVIDPDYVYEDRRDRELTDQRTHH